MTRSRDDRFTFAGRLWRHHGAGAWHLVTVPRDVADDIEEAGSTGTSSFGSVRVEATVGSTTWSTSSRHRGCGPHPLA